MTRIKNNKKSNKELNNTIFNIEKKCIKKQKVVKRITWTWKLELNAACVSKFVLCWWRWRLRRKSLMMTSAVFCFHSCQYRKQKCLSLWWWCVMCLFDWTCCCSCWILVVLIKEDWKIVRNRNRIHRYASSS